MTEITIVARLGTVNHGVWNYGQIIAVCSWLELVAQVIYGCYSKHHCAQLLTVRFSGTKEAVNSSFDRTRDTRDD
jgi:hypothetical protein